MRKIFDFKCPDGHVTEHFVYEDSKVRCHCGKSCKRVISPVKCQLDPASGHFPGATMKWIKEHERLGGETSEES